MSRDYHIACVITNLDALAEHALALKWRDLGFALVGYVARALSEKLKRAFPQCK